MLILHPWACRDANLLPLAGRDANLLPLAGRNANLLPWACKDANLLPWACRDANLLPLAGRNANLLPLAGRNANLATLTVMISCFCLRGAIHASRRLQSASWTLQYITVYRSANRTAWMQLICYSVYVDAIDQLIRLPGRHTYACSTARTRSMRRRRRHPCSSRAARVP